MDLDGSWMASKDASILDSLKHNMIWRKTPWCDLIQEWLMKCLRLKDDWTFLSSFASFFRGDLASVDLTSKAFSPSLQYPERLRLWNPSRPPPILLMSCQKMKKWYEISWRPAAQHVKTIENWCLIFVQLCNLQTYRTDQVTCKFRPDPEYEDTSNPWC